MEIKLLAIPFCTIENNEERMLNEDSTIVTILAQLCSFHRLIPIKKLRTARMITLNPIPKNIPVPTLLKKGSD